MGSMSHRRRDRDLGASFKTSSLSTLKMVENVKPPTAPATMAVAQPVLQTVNAPAPAPSARTYPSSSVATVAPMVAQATAPAASAPLPTFRSEPASTTWHAQPDEPLPSASIQSSALGPQSQAMTVGGAPFLQTPTGKTVLVGAIVVGVIGLVFWLKRSAR